MPPLVDKLGNLQVEGILAAFTFHGSQLLHKPALPAGSVVPMNDALLSGFIQRADGFQSCLASILNLAPSD